MTVERNAYPLSVGQDAGFERDASRMRDDLSGAHARATQDSSVDPYADHGERLAAEEQVTDRRPWRCVNCGDRFARPQTGQHSTEWRPRS